MALAKDNTLGAPTEGLGQRVTFAFDPLAAGPLMDEGIGATPVQSGVKQSGTMGAGQTGPTGVHAERDTATLDVLMKLAGAAVKPLLEKAQTEAYFNGMQRAAHGEAIQDIAESQPWYSTLFGESDVVEGARAYAGNTVAQTQLATMEDKMDELRQLGPDEAQKYFNGIVQSSLTGDAKTDTAITGAFMRGLPAVMRRQSKEHYGWQQNNAVTQQKASFLAEADKFQKAGAGYALDTISGQEYTDRAYAFQQSLLPPAGINEKNYLEGIKDLAMGAAARGQMHVVKVMLEGTGETDMDGNVMPGIASVLSEDQRRAVQAAAIAGERQQVSQFNDKNSVELAGIEYRAAHPEEGDVPTEQLKGMIDSYNERYAKSVGGVQAPISPAMQAAMLSRQGGVILAARVEEAKIKAKNAEVLRKEGHESVAAAELESFMQTYYGNGAAGDLVRSSIKGINGPSMNNALTKAYNADKDPEHREQALIAMYDGRQYIPESIKEQRVGRISSALTLAGKENFTPQVQGAFDEFYSLWGKSKGTAVATYAGDSNMAAKLSGYAAALDRGEDKLTAFTVNMTQPHASKHDLSDKDTKAAVSTLSSLNNGWIKGWMGDNTLEPGQAEQIAGELSVDIKAFRGSQHDAETSTQLAMNTHLSRENNRLEIMGGYAFRTNSKQMVDVTQFLTGTIKGPDGKPLIHRDGVGEENVSRDKVSKEFNAAVKAIAFGDRILGQARPSADAKDIKVIRGPDEGNVPQWMVTFIDAEGNAGRGWLRGTAIPQQAAKYRKYRKELDQSQGTTLPTTVGNRFQDRVMPNIVGKPTR